MSRINLLPKKTERLLDCIEYGTSENDHALHQVDLEVGNGSELKITEALNKVEEEDDPWDATNLQQHQTPWKELDGCGKVKRVLLEYILRVIMLLTLLYLFICSLDFLSSAFRLLGGRAAGRAFSNNEVLQNPIAGLMVGVLATVLVQSSSTSTSIVITMVGADLLKPSTAVAIIMGANIGTSVTNTIVSIGHISDKNEFRRAFGGATVHDMFNWLSVLVLLPIEIATNFIAKLSHLAVNSMNLTTYTDGKKDLLKTITKPFTKLVVSVDTKLISKIAQTGDDSVKSLIKIWCKTETVYRSVNLTTDANATAAANATEAPQVAHKLYIEKCPFMFMNVAGVWPDETIGAILLVIALVILCTCLVLIVRLLHLLLRGQIAIVLKKFINADFPGCLKYLTGYLAILIGAGLTVLVQSSSIFTSALTPLVGVGVLKLKRMYPLTLGSNIGTTSTGILAAMATSGENLPQALQVAFVHFFFNIFGIMIWYPLPWLRHVPIFLAKILGNTTAQYRWFALVYLFLMFLILPAFVFALSLLGWIVTVAVVVPLLLFFIVIVIINVIQTKRPGFLPAKLRNWDFLPKFLHSLDPYDRVIQVVLDKISCCKRCRQDRTAEAKQVEMDSVPAEKEKNGGVVNDTFTNDDEKTSCK